MTDSLLAFELEVRGEQYPNYDGSSRQPAIATVETGDPVFLVAELDNAHDRNAIEVRSTSGASLGYIRADQAAWMTAYVSVGWVESSVVGNKWYGDQTSAYHLWLDVAVRQPAGAADLLAAELSRRAQSAVLRPVRAPLRTLSEGGRHWPVAMLLVIGVIVLIALTR